MKHLLTSLLLITIYSTCYSAKHTVNASGMSFTPSTLSIQQYDTVIFNFINGYHTVTSSNDSWEELSGSSPRTFTLSAPFRTPGTYEYICVPHAPHMTGSITVATITGADSPLTTLSLNMYPNPTEGIINFNLPEQSGITTIQITDIQGSLVYQEKVNAASGKSFTIDLSENTPGIYFCNLLSKDVIVERKKIYFKK